MMDKQIANLSSLPNDLLVEIAKRLKKLEDFSCFRSVSKYVHASVNEECFEGIRLRQGTPYLMLPVRDDGNENIREFYSLVEGQSIVASMEIAKLNRKKCFESLGWLLVVEEDGSMYLLEPFCGTKIPVPHQNTFPGYEFLEMDWHIFIQKMVLSSRPSESSDFILMIIAGGRGHLAFWRLGDNAWNRIEARKGRFIDVVYGGGEQFYAVGYPGYVWIFNLAAENDNRVEVLKMIDCETIKPDVYGQFNLYILFTADDSLIVISRAIPYHNGENLYTSDDGLSLFYKTEEFEVFEVDIATSTWKQIDSLGTMAVFVGENSSIAVDASKYSGGMIKANHIYFTDDHWEYYSVEIAIGGGKDIGVYNLETGDIEPIYHGKQLLSRVSPPIWITPCF